MIYYLSSIALVYWNHEDSSLDCHCAVKTAIKTSFVGPEIFCKNTCMNNSSSNVSQWLVCCCTYKEILIFHKMPKCFLPMLSNNQYALFCLFYKQALVYLIQKDLCPYNCRKSRVEVNINFKTDFEKSTIVFTV